MKRYIMLTAREMRKHNAFGQTRYRVDKERAKARGAVAIDMIKEATIHLKRGLTSSSLSNNIAEAKVVVVDETPSSTKDESSADLDNLIGRLQVLSGDSSDTTSKRLKDLEISSGVTAQDLPTAQILSTAPPIPSPQQHHHHHHHHEKKEEDKSFTIEERAALDRLRLPSNAYANTSRSHEKPRVKTQSPYAGLLQSLRRNDDDDDSNKLPAYMRFDGTATSTSTTGKRRMSVGGVNEKDRRFRRALLNARSMRVIDCKMGTCIFCVFDSPIFLHIISLSYIFL